MKSNQTPAPFLYNLLFRLTGGGCVLALLMLGGCSKPGTLKSTLRDRLSDDPGVTSYATDGDSGQGLSRFKEELNRTSSAQNLPDSTAEFHFLCGELLLADEKYDEALDAFKKAQRALERPSIFLTKRIAQLHIRAGQLKEAIAEAKLGRESAPSDPELLQLLGGAYAASGQYPESRAEYQALFDNSSGKKREEAAIYLATLSAQMSDINGAKKILQQLVKENPMSALAYYYLARMHELEGDLPAAEKNYRHAVKLTPDNDALHLELARSLAAQRKLDEATDLAKKIVARSPQNQQARQVLGQLLLAANNVDDALTQLETLRSMESNPIETRMKIALIKLEQRDFDGAQSELEFVLANNANNTTARYYLALAYAGQNRVDQVVKNVELIDPSEKVFVESRLLAAYLLRQSQRLIDALALLNRADAKLPAPDIRILSFLSTIQKEAGQLADAAATQRRIVEIEPQKDTNQFMLAVLLDEIGDHEGSIAACRKALELNPKNADALNFLGYSFVERKERLEEAKDLIRRAIDLEPKNGYFIDSLGWALYQEGKHKEAVLELERAVSFTADDAVILEHLASAYAKTGQPDKALDTARKALTHAPRSDDKEVGARVQELVDQLERSLHSGAQ